MMIHCTLSGLALAVFFGGATLAADAPPTFGLPIDCESGKTCWVVNYVDHDATDGIDDYMCGKASYNEPPHNRHIGTDFAIRDLAAMRKGVAALAAEPGVVRGTRDGVKDVDIKDIGGPAAVKGFECGNWVVVDHPGGWSTQYCHLRQGSVKVKKGDRLKAGQAIGLVGLSGLTEFPHVHFTVRKGEDAVDPFVGTAKKTCSVGTKPLWAAATLAKIPYQPTAVYTFGFIAETPDVKAARDGAYTATNFPASSPSLVLWADIFWVQPGDEVLMTVTDPNGVKLFEGRRTIERLVARSFNVAGKPRPPARRLADGRLQGRDQSQPQRQSRDRRRHDRSDDPLRARRTHTVVTSEPPHPSRRMPLACSSG